VPRTREGGGWVERTAGGTGGGDLVPAHADLDGDEARVGSQHLRQVPLEERPDDEERVEEAPEEAGEVAAVGAIALCRGLWSGINDSLTSATPRIKLKGQAAVQLRMPHSPPPPPGGPFN